MITQVLVAGAGPVGLTIPPGRYRVLAWRDL
jgi:hypothetical protein